MAKLMTMHACFLLRTGLAFLAAGLIATGSATAADDKAKPRPVSAAEESVTLNFVNADIEAVIKAVCRSPAKISCSIRASKARSTSFRPSRCRTSLAYHVFLSALRLQGFAAVEDNGVTKIVPEADAKTQAGPDAQRQQAGRRATRC